MKKAKILLVLISIITAFVLSFCNNKTENYGLNILSDITEYDRLVSEYPANELVDIEKFVPGIALDIRYATSNNFTGEIIYKSAKAYIRKPVAEALAKIQSELMETGAGLKIFDAYRPYEATLRFYAVYPDTNFVAAPWRGSVHNRGCAVDLTLINLETQKDFIMPTLFDDFTEKAAHSYTDLSDEVIKNRQTLLDIMTKYEFEKYDSEWWHYNYKGWEKYPLMNINFENLSN